MKPTDATILTTHSSDYSVAKKSLNSSDLVHKSCY